MKKFQFVLIVTGLLFIGRVNGQSIKLMTYNIRLDLASDGQNAWDHRKDFLVSEIRFFAPDIFGTQEGLPNQIAYIKEKLPEYNAVGPGREGEGKGESTSIFYNTQKYELQQTHTFWLSATPDQVSKGWDASYLRICTYALLKNKKTGKKIWVFNTHLDNKGVIARKNGLALILEHIKKPGEKTPVILMGDFNSTPESEVIKTLKQEMTDTREACISKPFGPEQTFNNFEYDKLPEQRIDYIFISHNAPFTVKKYAVLNNSLDHRYPSDHFPVLIELERVEGKGSK